MEIKANRSYRKYLKFNTKFDIQDKTRKQDHGFKSNNINEIKDILTRCIEQSKSINNIVESNSHATSFKKIKSRSTKRRKKSPITSYGKNFDNHLVYNSLKIHCQSPLLRIRKSNSKAHQVTNNSSMNIKKLTVNQSSPLKNYMIKRHYFPKKLKNDYSKSEFSNCTSYSNIVRLIMDKYK